MKAVLRRTRRTSCWILAAALLGGFTLAGCGDDDEDYTETFQNCQVIDGGEGEQYEVCCTVTCHYHYDYDEYAAQCHEDRTCSTSAGSPCPDGAVDEHDYPHCYY